MKNRRRTPPISSAAYGIAYPRRVNVTKNPTTRTWELYRGNTHLGRYPSHQTALAAATKAAAATAAAATAAANKNTNR